MALQVHSTVAANAAVGALLKFVQNKGAVQGPCDCKYYENKIIKLEEKIQKLDPSTPQQKKYKQYLKEDLKKSDEEIDANIEDLKDFFKQTFSQEAEVLQISKLKGKMPELDINMKIIIAPLIYSYYLTSTRSISDETFDKLKKFSPTKSDTLLGIRNQQKLIEPLYDNTEFIKTIKGNKEELTKKLKEIGILDSNINDWLNLILPFKSTPYYIKYSESQKVKQGQIRGTIEKKYKDEKEKYEKLKNIIKTAKSKNANTIIFTEEFKKTDIYINQNDKKQLDPFITGIAEEIEEDIRLERIKLNRKKKLSKDDKETQINTLRKEKLKEYSSREEQKILNYKEKSEKQIEEEIKKNENAIRLNPDEQPDRIHWQYFEKEILLPAAESKKGGSRINKTRKIKRT
jgi:hypothetical protein